MLDASDLDCGVCFSLLIDPITIGCGHTFCRSCLEQSVDVKRNCPMCRNPCYLDVANLPSNALVVKIVEKCFPEQLKARVLEVKRERRTRQQNLPVFVSNFVYFPGHLVNLHIYEMKYRFMVHQCMSTNRKFIIATSFENYLNPLLVNHRRSFHEDEAKLEYGVVVRITECVPLPDGRSMVKAMADRRVKLENIHREENTVDLLYASVVDYVDAEVDGEIQTSDQTLDQLRERLLIRADEFLRLRGTTLDNYVQTASESLASYDTLAYSLWIPGLIYPERNLTIRSLKAQAFLSQNVSDRLQMSSELLSAAITMERRSRNIRSYALIIIILVIFSYSIYSSKL